MRSARRHRRSEFSKIVFFGALRRPRHDIPGRDATLARRLRPHQLAPRGADALRAQASARQWRRDRRPGLATSGVSADAEVAAAVPRAGSRLGRDRDRRRRLAVPSLVLHRRGDRTVPIRHGREVAALLPNARFVALSPVTRISRRWTTSASSSALLQASSATRFARRPTAAPHSHAERPKCCRLVAAGLSNREIASSLVLSEHTVHRHVANILRKLAQSSRAAAAAHATRAGVI